MIRSEDVERARSLLQELYAPSSVDYCTTQCRPTIYDTAWVAMLSRTTASTGNRELVFPQSFQYLLDHQQANGGWEMRDFKLGTILNTLAGLLAILKRKKHLSLEQNDVAASLNLRATKATDFLRRQLATWDPKSDEHFDSIILAPVLLAMLRAEDIHFDFRGSAELDKRRSERLCRAESSPQQSINTFDPKLDYVRCDMGSLPRRLGKVDSSEGIACSPSSTAAFMLHYEGWSEEYEAYLSAAVNSTRTSGGVPSLFPPSFTEPVYVSSSNTSLNPWSNDILICMKTIEVLADSGLLEATVTAQTVHFIIEKVSHGMNNSSNDSMLLCKLMTSSTTRSTLLLNRRSYTMSGSFHETSSFQAFYALPPGSAARPA